MSTNFNEFVCVDHFHLHDHDVFHVMETTSRYSVSAVIE